MFSVKYQSLVVFTIFHRCFQVIHVINNMLLKCNIHVAHVYIDDIILKKYICITGIHLDR